MFPGKEDLRAEFIFSKEWERALKVVGFYSIMGTEYPPQVIVNNACDIPTEASRCPVFQIKVFGTKGRNVIKTDYTVIRQGGKK